MSNRRVSIRALAGALLLASATAQAGGTVVFRDDFDGTGINSAAWSVGTWTLGRTQLGNAPRVSGGIHQVVCSGE